MYRLATLLALLILAAAGCGGSDGDDSDSSPPAVANAPSESSGSDDTPAGSSSKDEPEQEQKKKKGEKKPVITKEEADTDDDGKLSEEEIHEAQAKAYLRLPTSKQAVIVKTVARVVLLQFNMKLADVELSDRGRSIKVLITRASACQGVASQEPQMVAALKGGIESAKKVSFAVAPSGQAFGYYVLRCKKPEMPNGPGRKVFEHTGVGGTYTSPPIEIKGDRWALEWENLGATLAVIVIATGGEAKREKMYFKPVGSQKAESGRYNYRGSGTFQLKIHGASRWSVRIKEIR